MSPLDNVAPRASSHLLHPPVIREKGAIDITYCHGELQAWHLSDTWRNSTNMVIKKHLNRSSNEKRHAVETQFYWLMKWEWKRKKFCLKCGGRSMLFHCTMCHHNHCFDICKNNSSESPTFEAISTNKKDKDVKLTFKHGIVSCFHYVHRASCLGDDEIDSSSATPPLQSWNWQRWHLFCTMCSSMMFMFLLFQMFINDIYFYRLRVYYFFSIFI